MSQPMPSAAKRAAEEAKLPMYLLRTILVLSRSLCSDRLYSYVVAAAPEPGGTEAGCKEPCAAAHAQRSQACR